jgi:hypothetical protein
MDDLLAAFSNTNLNDRSSLVTQFAQILGVDNNTAQFFLESAGWNVETAINAFLSSVGHGSNIVTSSSPQGIFLGDASITTTKQFQPGEEIAMNWIFQNSGPTSWPADAALVHMDGPAMCSQNVLYMGGIPPAATHQLQVVLTVPMIPGQYASTWRLRHNGGYFGDCLYIILSVAGVANTVPVLSNNNNSSDAAMEEDL